MNVALIVLVWVVSLVGWPLLSYAIHLDSGLSFLGGMVIGCLAMVATMVILEEV